MMIESTQPPNLLPNLKPDSPKEVPFSSSLTALCLMFCVCGFAFLLWSIATSEVEFGSVTASRDLERLASRMLGFESRLTELSAFEQGLYHLWGENGETQEEFRKWYGEIPKERRNHLDQLYMGILEGEAMLRAESKGPIEVWSPGIQQLPPFQQILDVVYLDGNIIDVDYHGLQARLAEDVPANWFYFQLARRLASQFGDLTLRHNLQQQFQQLTEAQLWKWRALVLLECTLVGLGAVGFVSATVRWGKQRDVKSPRALNQRANLWTFHEGFAVLVRGGTLSILLIAFLAVMPYGISLLENFGALVLYLPTIGLAMVWLGPPQSQSFLGALGCKGIFQRLRSSLAILLSVVALGLIGEWCIMIGGEAFEVSVHWTEWFLPPLVWGSRAELLKMTLEVVVIAPIFEEFIFRGILFSTLRANFGLTASMIGSAGIFAVAHGYGPVAFLTVFWSGLLWAWLYERTGSVIPGMCAHAINNGLVVYFLVALFR